jgi:chromosome partitioning protein
VIAIASQKGGVGKSTTAVNLAHGLTLRGRSALLIDLDAQRNASTWLGLDADGRELADVFDGRGRLDALVRDDPRASVIPGSPWLATVERGAKLSTPKRVADQIRAVSRRFDVTLIDTPPGIGVAVHAALGAADEVLIPLDCSDLALPGLTALEETIADVREAINAKLRIGGVLIGRFDARLRIARDIEEALRGGPFARHLLQTRIRESVRLRECWSHRQTVFEYDPKGSGADDFGLLAAEIDEKGKR